MKNCMYCGASLNEQAKFCHECGTPVIGNEYTNSEEKMRRCPSCGSIMNAFEIKCSFCNTDLRGIRSSETVSEFSERFSKAATEREKISIVRSFPIPNTKEDIVEFMILAASNIDIKVMRREKDQKALSEAWRAKFDQSYQKARLLFGNDPVLRNMDDMYKRYMARYTGIKILRILKYGMAILVNLLARSAVVICGILVLLYGIKVDRGHGNSSMIELLACIALTASAATIKKRKGNALDGLIAGVSGLLTIVLSEFYSNGSLVELGGGITLIVAAVSTITTVVKK